MKTTSVSLFYVATQWLLPGARAECYNNLTSLRRTGDLDELYAQHVLIRNRYMCNGPYKFGVDDSGALIYGDVGKDEVIQRTNDVGSYLVMQNDGNLVFRDSNGDTRWQTDTQGHENTKITLYADGSIKIKDDKHWEYNLKLRPYDWDNDDQKPPDKIDCIGDKIYGRFNDALFPGDYICLGDKRFGIDKISGDLVYSYGNDSTPIASQTKARSYLLMQQNGNSIYYGGKWKTRTKEEIESHAGVLSLKDKSGSLFLEVSDLTTQSVKFSYLLHYFDDDAYDDGYDDDDFWKE